MLISKTTQQAVRALIIINNLTSSDTKKISLKEIASRISAPAPYTGKIMQALSKSEFCSSTKGPGGGFFANENTSKTKVSQIVEAIEGPDYGGNCMLGLPDCSDSNPCPAHFKYRQVRNEINQLFERLVIGDLSDTLDLDKELYRIGS